MNFSPIFQQKFEKELCLQKNKYTKIILTILFTSQNRFSINSAHIIFPSSGFIIQQQNKKLLELLQNAN